MITRRQVRWAVGLWLTFAFVVWNVIFDRMVVLAGRRYSYDAYLRFHTAGQYLKIDEVMRPAVARAVEIASLTAAGIVLVAMSLIWLAAKTAAPRSLSGRAEGAPDVGRHD